MIVFSKDVVLVLIVLCVILTLSVAIKLVMLIFKTRARIKHLDEVETELNEYTNSPSASPSSSVESIVTPQHRPLMSVGVTVENEADARLVKEINRVRLTKRGVLPLRGTRPKVNRTHPLARGLVGYQLFNEHTESTDLNRQPIFCYDRELNRHEIAILSREPYCMFDITESVEEEEKVEEYPLLGRKLRMRTNGDTGTT